METILVFSNATNDQMSAYTEATRAECEDVAKKIWDHINYHFAFIEPDGSHTPTKLPAYRNVGSMA